MLKRFMRVITSMMIVISLSGCGIFNFSFSLNDDNVAQSERVVAEFCNDIRSNSIGEFQDYFTEDSNFYDNFIKISDFSFIADKELAKLGDYRKYISDETFEEWRDEIVWRIYANIDYTITDIKSEGNDVKVYVTMSVPDFDRLADISDIDINSIISEAFGPDISDEETFFEELSVRKCMEIEDAREYYKQNGKDIYIKDVLELFNDEWDKVVSKLSSNIFEVCELVQYPIIFTVIQQMDDSYKIKEVNDNK